MLLIEIYTLKAENVIVKIYNISGIKLVETKTVSDFNTKLPAGYYIVEVVNSDLRAFRTKVIVK